jgi:hypothetical protein
MEDDTNPRALLPFATAGVYCGALIYLGSPTWRAVAVGLAVLIAILLNCGRTTLMRGGVVIVFASLAVWSQAGTTNWFAILAKGN